MRKTIALIIIIGCVLVFISSCSLGGGQSAGEVTTQTSQLTSTVELESTPTPSQACDPIVNLVLPEDIIEYYWSMDSSSIIYTDQYHSIIWHQLLIRTGQIVDITQDMAERLVGHGMRYGFRTHSTPEDTYFDYFSPTNNLSLYFVFVSSVNIEPTPVGTFTPTPTIDPSYMSVGEHWNGGTLIYTFEVLLRNEQGETFSLGTVNGDAFGVYWFPDGSGALIVRYQGHPGVDWTSPFRVWRADFGQHTLQEIDPEYFQTFEINGIGISPDNRYFLYRIRDIPNLYVYDLVNQNVSTYFVDLGTRIIWWDNDEEYGFWYLNHGNLVDRLYHYSLTDPSQIYTTNLYEDILTFSGAQAMSPNQEYLAGLNDESISRNHVIYVIHRLLVYRICG